MPPSPATADNEAFARTLLARLPGGLERYRPRRMFGGLALLGDNGMFAFATRSRFYARVSPDMRARCEAAGMRPFRPFGMAPMRRYYEVPPQVRDDPAELEIWLERAAAQPRQLKAATRRQRQRAAAPLLPADGEPH